MNSLAKRFLFWTPRIITIFFAILLSIFSLDVVVEGRGLGQVMLAILIHQIPVFLIVIALVVAWRREWVGTVLFIGLALFYLIFAWGRFPLVTYLAISGPLFLVGVLFQLNWVYKDIEVEKVEEKSDLKKLKLSIYIQAMVNVGIWAVSMIAMVILMQKSPIVKNLYPILAGGAAVGISLIYTISKLE